MKLLLDFLPILLFFGAYKLYGIYVGTAVLMGATVVQMAIIYAIDKKLTTMHKATLALILVFGTLTLCCRTNASSSGSPPCSTPPWPSRWRWRCGATARIFSR